MPVSSTSKPVGRRGDLEPAEERAQLGRLVAVAGREDDPHAAPRRPAPAGLEAAAAPGRARRCRPRPGRAGRRAPRARRCCPSAVACTSIRRPEPVMTTFMSDAARRVLGVGEVEQRRPSTMPTLTAATESVSGQALERAARHERAEGQPEGDPGAADAGAAGAAVGLQDVAVEPDRALAERLHVDHGAQRAADQALDLGRCGRRACRGRCRAPCGRRSRRGASRTRPSPSRGRGRASRRGTLSSTEAVQITRVRPTEIRALPSAVSTKPGQDLDRAQLVLGCVRRLASGGA